MTTFLQLRDYVARGGSLIATFETALYDEHGRRRETFGLADLFGVDVAGADAGLTNVFAYEPRGDEAGYVTGVLAAKAAEAEWQSSLWCVAGR